MIRESLLIALALLYSAAVAAIGRRLSRPASGVAYGTALATLLMVLLLSESTRQRVDGLLWGMGTTWRLTCPAANALERSVNHRDGAIGKVKTRMSA